MARQNDLRTYSEARADYDTAASIEQTISHQLADLRAKMLRVFQDRMEAGERLAVLDREYQS